MGAMEWERGLPHPGQGPGFHMLCNAISGGKTLGGAFYQSLALAGGKPGARWPGDETEAPEEGHLLPAVAVSLWKRLDFQEEA